MIDVYERDPVYSDGLPSSYQMDYLNAVGYTISIGGILQLKEKLALSLRSVYQNDSNGDTTFFIRMGLLVEF
ncbi:MAG: hypothetical protein RBS73_18155 [Prolixibacteraceae bacterium]|jgi:hypothetical protein|nr:hypothetical protein [Prolixibacteraceae bacterium]